MKLSIYLIITAALLASILIYNSNHPSQEKMLNKHQVQALPPKIIAGEVHYSRIPVEYWEHRLQSIKAMGFNALSVYIMWNYHQIEKGRFDYQTENKNLPLFLSLAQKYGLYVLIRPGPYVCAEWDFGGFPARLLNIDGIKLRANNAVYLNEVKVYFESLVPVLKPYWAKNGGNIILLQIENEYGFYGSDKSYMEALRTMWSSLDIDSEQYYVDTVYNLEKCYWSAANIGINDGNTEVQYEFAKTLGKTGVIFGGQIYSGWLTHWGESFQGKNITKYNQQFEFLLSKNHSFSMYMVHGGSNFALTAGANAYTGKADYKGHITSYDYDAPIDQQGSPNAKFQSFRNLAKQYLPWEIPEPPAPINTIQIPYFTPLKIASLFSNLPTPAFVKAPSPYLFQSKELQMFNQGFVLYETTLTKDTHYLTISARDFALVYLDGTFLGALDRAQSINHNVTANCTQESCKLSILVEAMGHINFDHQMQTDKKGLFFFNDTRSIKFQWTIYKINVDNNILSWRSVADPRAMPSLFMSSITLNEVGDTFLNLGGFKKGYVWVNGRNLGRYWNIGPSQKLFCPGVWLKKGVNDIYVLDLLTTTSSSITGDKSLK